MTSPEHPAHDSRGGDSVWEKRGGARAKRQSERGERGSEPDRARAREQRLSLTEGGKKRRKVGEIQPGGEGDEPERQPERGVTDGRRGAGREAALHGTAGVSASIWEPSVSLALAFAPLELTYVGMQTHA